MLLVLTILDIPIVICVHIGPFLFLFWKKNENVLYLIIASKKALKYPYYITFMFIHL